MYIMHILLLTLDAPGTIKLKIKIKFENKNKNKNSKT